MTSMNSRCDDCDLIHRYAHIYDILNQAADRLLALTTYLTSACCDEDEKVPVDG